MYIFFFKMQQCLFLMWALINKLASYFVSLFKKHIPQNTINMPASWWAYDIKWKYDTHFSYETYFWATAWQLPKKVFINNTRVQNQWKQTLTLYACTAYSAVHASNDLVFKEWGNVEHAPEDIDWIDLRGDALANWAHKDGGRTINWPLELLRQRGIITWYTVVDTLEWVKSALARWLPICTWAQNVMWNVAYQTWIARRDNQNQLWGHAFTIHWYDDDRKALICKNSYWPWVMNGWYFYVEYPDFNKLWTNYVLHNKENASVLKQARMDLNLKIAKERWIWNWVRANDTISRSERTIVCNRLSLVWQTYQMMLRKDAVNYLMEEEKRIKKALVSSKL